MEEAVTFCHLDFPRKSSIFLGRLFFEDCLRALKNFTLNSLLKKSWK